MERRKRLPWWKMVTDVPSLDCPRGMCWDQPAQPETLGSSHTLDKESVVCTEGLPSSFGPDASTLWWWSPCGHFGERIRKWVGGWVASPLLWPLPKLWILCLEPIGGSLHVWFASLSTAFTRTWVGGRIWGLEGIHPQTMGAGRLVYQEDSRAGASEMARGSSHCRVWDAMLSEGWSFSGSKNFSLGVQSPRFWV